MPCYDSVGLDDLPNVDRVLRHSILPARSAALRPASKCFSASIICASLLLLLLILSLRLKSYFGSDGDPGSRHADLEHCDKTRSSAEELQ